MPKYFLVFLNGAWHRTNRLPVPTVAPPAAHQIKWLIQGWGEYIVCERNRLWRQPHVNAQGRKKNWKEVLLVEKNEGYKGVNFWREGVRHYYSLPQLRRLLYKNPIYTAASVPQHLAATDAMRDQDSGSATGSANTASTTGEPRVPTLLFRALQLI